MMLELNFFAYINLIVVWKIIETIEIKSVYSLILSFLKSTSLLFSNLSLRYVQVLLFENWLLVIQFYY